MVSQARNKKLHFLASQAEGHRRTREAHLTELAEDYVEVIAQLIETRGEARAVDIASCLGVTHVTVTKSVSRLQRDGLVVSEPYRAIFLTEAGKKMADRCRKRHEVVLDFLLALGVSPRAAQADAEGIEHHVSEETLKVFQSFTNRIRKG